MIIENTLTRKTYFKYLFRATYNINQISSLFSTFVVIFVAKSLFEWDFKPESLASSAIFALILTFVFFLLGIIALYNQTGAEANRNTFLPERLVIDGTGIGSVTAVRESKTKWAGVVGWKFAAGCYFIYISSTYAWIIPRTSVATADIPVLEALLKKNVK